MRKKKPGKKISPKRKTTRRRISRQAKKVIRKTKTIRKRKKSRSRKPAREKRQIIRSIVLEEKGLGSETGGQSGDIQGLSNIAGADSESVQELAEEGQAYEAEVVRGVENAPDADEAEVSTTEVPVDDVPAEYRNKERG
jgi:N utilization substance protein A